MYPHNPSPIDKAYGNPGDAPVEKWDEVPDAIRMRGPLACMVGLGIASSGHRTQPGFTTTTLALLRERNRTWQVAADVRYFHTSDHRHRRLTNHTRELGPTLIFDEGFLCASADF